MIELSIKYLYLSNMPKNTKNIESTANNARLLGEKMSSKKQIFKKR